MNKLSMLTAVLLAALAFACGGGGKQAAPPDNTSGGSGGTGASGGSAGSAGGSAGGTSGSGSGGGNSGGTGGGSAGSGGAGGNDPCISPLGCYSCKPTTTDQFLNACVGDGTCGYGYDNSLVPALVANGGKKPPLP